MSRRSCSHCGRNDHDKRKCPDLDKTTEECWDERHRESNAYFSAANVIAEILGKYPPEKRVELSMEGFRRAECEFAGSFSRALRERESKASALVKAEMAKWEPARTQAHEKRQARREGRRRAKAPTLQLLKN